MIRLFVGIRPPQPVRAALDAIMTGAGDVRWQADEQLYVTLRFIGEVERPVAEDIAAVLGHVYAPAFDLHLEGVGSFERGPRGSAAIWAGVRPHDRIAALHRKIDHALTGTGLPPERRAYLPHITLARLRRMDARTTDWLAARAGFSGPAFAVDHFLLYQSHLGREGARYEPVARYSLVPRDE